MRVTPNAGLRPDYELKLNSYDLSVDIELRDAVQRLRFEHPEVRAVVVTGGLDKVFCAGANIQMLAGSTHGHKVNFCKFTNETRCQHRGRDDDVRPDVDRRRERHGCRRWVRAGAGVRRDPPDRRSGVGDLAPGGAAARRAARHRRTHPGRRQAPRAPRPRRRLHHARRGRSRASRRSTGASSTPSRRAAASTSWSASGRSRAPRRRPAPPTPAGVELTPLAVDVAADSLRYRSVVVEIDRTLGAAHITLVAPPGPQPSEPRALAAAGATAWVLAAARQLDDAILRLRFNEPEIGTWVLHSTATGDDVAAAEDLLGEFADHWLVHEIRSAWTQTLKHLDLSARTLVALIEPGSCFTGTLAELALAADRSFMLDGPDPNGDAPPATLRLTAANDGWFPTASGLSRLATRCWGRDDVLDAARSQLGKDLLAADAAAAGLVTFTPDDLDWDDEIRLALEERNSFSPDALTGMEANYRFVGPETMETKIFGRLTAWQNWIFQRPNAVGPEGALQRFGTGPGRLRSQEGVMSDHGVPRRTQNVDGRWPRWRSVARHR